MGENYEKSVFQQLTEVMTRLDVMESEHKRDCREIKRLTDEVVSLSKDNMILREEVSCLKQKNAVLEEKCKKLEEENHILRNDNERMKRILNNDSSNSSIPPSQDLPGKAPNTFNGRKPTKKKQGAQPGHKGSGTCSNTGS